MAKKKVLVIDEPPIVDNILARLDSWGQEGIGLSKVARLEEAILQHDIGVIILAKEMKIKGGSLFEALLDRDPLQKMEEIEIDHEFGINLYERIRNIGTLPVIYTTTEDLNDDTLRCYRSLNGQIRAIFIEKPFGAGEALKAAVEACLNTPVP